MNSEKPYTITIEHRDDFLWAVVGGKKLTADIAAAYWDEIAQKCADENCKKVLIEKDFEIPAGPEDLIKMAAHLAAVLPTNRVAFVDRWDHENVNELGKRLARNQNVMMQTFSDTHDAEKWLRAN